MIYESERVKEEINFKDVFLIIFLLVYNFKSLLLEHLKTNVNTMGLYQGILEKEAKEFVMNNFNNSNS
jgi:hypothetical protein